GEIQSRDLGQDPDQRDRGRDEEQDHHGQSVALVDRLEEPVKDERDEDEEGETEDLRPDAHAEQARGRPKAAGRVRRITPDDQLARDVEESEDTRNAAQQVEKSGETGGPPRRVHFLRSDTQTDRIGFSFLQPRSALRGSVLAARQAGTRQAAAEATTMTT